MPRHCESRKARGNLALLWGEGVVIVREVREIREVREGSCVMRAALPKFL